MSPKELFYFAAFCLAPDAHTEYRETVISAFSSRKVSLDSFIALCDRHLILPAIYLHFKKYKLLDIFPTDYKEHLAVLYLKNKKRNQEILQQVVEINHALATKNITPVYLKGTANLLDNVYSDIGERMIGDIDLLVQEKDYLHSAELIMQLGYRTDGKVYYDVTASKHYPRLYRTDVPADIEIHRVPVEIAYSKQFNSEFIYRNKRKIPDKTNCFAPSDEHKAIHNFIHAQLGNLGYRFKQNPLRDLYDMYLLSKRIVLTSVIGKVEEKRKISTYLTVTKRIFGGSIMAEIEENNTSRRYIKIHDWFLDHPKTHGRYILTVKLFEVFVVRFFRGGGKVFRAKSWRNFFTNITDPDWYKMMKYRITNFYSNYISKK